MERIQAIPRQTVEADFAANRACAICGVAALAVIHLERLPDHIKCSNCGSAFVLSEGANLVMYGSIPADYPSTRSFALKRWVALAAVQVKAIAERTAARPEPAANSNSTALREFEQSSQPEPDAPDEPTPAFGINAAIRPDNRAAARAATPPFGYGTLSVFLGQQPGTSPSLTTLPEGEPKLSHESAEPESGRRFEVAVPEVKASFPAGLCAHCLRQPAPMRLVVIGDDAKRTRYQIPLCRQCHLRASARGEAERNSRVAVHLVSVLTGMVLVVAAIGFRIADIREAPLAAGVLLGMLGLIGYTVPAWLLLTRLSHLPPPPDAAFVRSTLQVRPGAPTTFAWRSRGYAERFALANAVSEVGKVLDSRGP